MEARRTAARVVTAWGAATCVAALLAYATGEELAADVRTHADAVWVLGSLGCLWLVTGLCLWWPLLGRDESEPDRSDWVDR